MRSSTFFVLVCWLAGVHAKKGTEAEFKATMTLTPTNLQDAFDGMNAKDDLKIDMEDLKLHYFHKEAEFATSKFLELISKDGNKEVSRDELDAFLKKQPVTNAVWECTYIRSESMREFCFADQITYYVYLLLDHAAIDTFFKSIEDSADADEVIKVEEVKKMAALNNKFTEKAIANFMNELGGTDGQIKFDEFEEYVSEEDLLDDFRECRKNVVGVNAEYDNECLKKELIDYTMNHMTLKDMIALYDEFEDDSDNDLDITAEDIKKHSECNDDVAKKFIRLMDKTKDEKVNFAEFRTYVRSPLVILNLEADCASEIEDQAQEIECYKKKLLKRVEEFHTPIWLTGADLDMLFLFEELDITNNGKITVDEDLVKGHGWPKDVATKMVNEMDGRDDDTDVDLSELMVYVHWPNIVYGITECISLGRNDKSISCYNVELKDNIASMLDKPKVLELFNYYDKDGSHHITRKEVEAAGVTGEDVQNFLDEMGMGDDTITEDEFTWYIRQQELSKMFKACKQEAELHMTLLDFMENRFTEYDTQELFDVLDTNDDWELDHNNFATADLIALHQVRDCSQKHDSVNFMEFWVFLHTPMNKPRKKYLEEKCTKPNEDQTKEMECYQKEMKNVSN